VLSITVRNRSGADKVLIENCLPSALGVSLNEVVVTGLWTRLSPPWSLLVSGTAGVVMQVACKSRCNDNKSFVKPVLPCDRAAAYVGSYPFRQCTLPT